MSAEKRFLSISELPPQIKVPHNSPFQLYRIIGTHLYLSGHGPSWGNDFSQNLGKVGVDLSTDQAYCSARICMLNLLQTTRAVIGSLDQVESIIDVFGIVNSVDNYTEHSKVMNGASELLGFVFKEKSHHTRVAIGASSLPFDFSVEIKMTLIFKL